MKLGFLRRLTTFVRYVFKGYLVNRLKHFKFQCGHSICHFICETHFEAAITLKNKNDNKVGDHSTIKRQYNHKFQYIFAHFTA